jgi:NAD(P)-dependent dehydrogenase (short-subunit alcohol dehydrogenase family)
LDINLKGQFLCAQAVAREMVRDGRGGKILNIASLAALAAFPRESAYNASKAGVILLTKTLAVELAPYKINVNAIAPSTIRTPLAERTLSDPERLARYMANVPLKRVGEPEDLVGTCIFLASSASDFITGQSGSYETRSPFADSCLRTNIWGKYRR